MAKLIVSDGYAFDTDSFPSQFDSLDNVTTKTADDVWRVGFIGGEAFVRSEEGNLAYDKMGTPDDKSDDVVKSGDISSFSFNAWTMVEGETVATVRIRGIDNLGGMQVHDALESSNPNAAFEVLRTVFHGDDVLQGADMADTLVGFSGADKISGHEGGDALYGGHGADNLKGNIGADFLDGGDGKDRMDGGNDTDVDTFTFANGDSGKDSDHADSIRNFTSGTDKIDLSATSADESEIHVRTHDGASKVVIDAHDGEHKMVILVHNFVDTGDLILA